MEVHLCTFKLSQKSPFQPIHANVIRSETGCSKLTTSFVNVLLKFQKLYLKHANIFVGKMWEAFEKNIRVFGLKS